jgi:hypothetical protein
MCCAWLTWINHKNVAAAMASRKDLKFSLPLNSPYPQPDTNDLPEEVDGADLMPLSQLFSILQPYDPAEDLAFFNTKEVEDTKITKGSAYNKWVKFNPRLRLPDESEDLRL